MTARTALLAATIAAVIATPAAATITWGWSFQGQAGQFVTDGSLVGGSAAAGTYNLQDFSVTSSSTGAPAGSLSGGQYVGDGYGTVLPYDFNWNGSAVTFWNSAGINTYDWWVFGIVGSQNSYFFAVDAANVNDPSKATLYNFNSGVISAGTVTVSPSGTVPEPASWALMIAGFGLVGVAARRRAKLPAAA